MGKKIVTLMAMLVGGVVALSSIPAFAGPQYVDGSGYAVSGYDVVTYFDKGQSAVGEPQPAPTPGRANITADWNGATWAFATAENRDRFVAKPEAFAPAFDGHCAFGVVKGGKVPGDPQYWRIVDGRLYLNLQSSVQRMWLADISGNIATATKNWPDLVAQPASQRSLPELAAGTAPVAD